MEFILSLILLYSLPLDYKLNFHIASLQLQLLYTYKKLNSKKEKVFSNLNFFILKSAKWGLLCFYRMHIAFKVIK